MQPTTEAHRIAGLANSLDQAEATSRRLVDQAETYAVGVATLADSGFVAAMRQLRDGILGEGRVGH